MTRSARSSSGIDAVAKYCQIARVLGAGQQQHVGVLGRAARAADLLVVGDGRRRRAEVQHEAEVGLVEAHAERARGDERLDLVALEQRLGLLALVGVGLAGVGAHVVPAPRGAAARCRRRQTTVSV